MYIHEYIEIDRQISYNFEVPGGSGASALARVENECWLTMYTLGKPCPLLVECTYIANLIYYVSILVRRALFAYLVVAAHRCPCELKMNFDRLAGGVTFRKLMFSVW